MNNRYQNVKFQKVYIHKLFICCYYYYYCHNHYIFHLQSYYFSTALSSKIEWKKREIFKYTEVSAWHS